MSKLNRIARYGWAVAEDIFNGMKAGIYITYPFLAAVAAGGFTYLILNCGCSR